MKVIFYILLLFTVCSCSSDEPGNKLTLSDLLHTSWTGEQVETMENGEIQTINFIVLFSTEQEGVVTYLSSTGTPIQNFPIYYRIEGDVMFLKGAFNGEYRIIKHSHNVIDMEAYLPNHSLITLWKK
ncbi:MAG: hypothetical protein K2L17_06005 [Muribaculaceae bacterium]|nr:hypothetical protein [Muribaculaceae bacterium]